MLAMATTIMASSVQPIFMPDSKTCSSVGTVSALRAVQESWKQQGHGHTLAKTGSRGSLTMCFPSGSVRSPLLSSAPRAKRSSIALRRADTGGRSMKSKPSTSLMPSCFSCSTNEAKLTRCISGAAALGSARKAASVYSRYAFPGASRPAHVRRFSSKARWCRL